MSVVASFALVVAELRRGTKGHLAYPVQAVSELAGVVFVAALAAYAPAGFPGDAGLASGGLGAGARLAGFMMAFVALAGLQVVHRVVREESDVGTLEQLCLSPFGLPTIIAARCFADTVRLAPLFLAAVGLAGPLPGLAPRVISAAGAALLMNAGMLGMGFVIGSLTLVFKRTGFIANLAGIAMLPLALSPLEGLPAAVQRVASLVPFTHAVRLVRALMTEATARELLVGAGALCASGAMWLLVGAGVFLVAERFARARGLLGKY